MKIEKDVLPFSDLTCECAGCGTKLTRHELTDEWRLIGWQDDDGDYHNKWACSEECFRTWRLINIDFYCTVMYEMGSRLADMTANLNAERVRHGVAPLEIKDQ